MCHAENEEPSDPRPDDGAPPRAPSEGGSSGSLVKPPGGPVGVVAIGASAGGLAPLRAFFRSLPPDTGGSFIVLQHLSPDEPSVTPELLKSDTSMPRRRAEDGMAPQTNEIVFLPPGTSLILRDGLFRLQEGGRSQPTASVIDTFLRSLAVDLGPAMIGILLSGTGSDGTRGLTAVKDHGGLTMVQDPATAEFDGMPSSAIEAGAVDFVGSVPELAAKVVDFLARDPATVRLPRGVRAPTTRSPGSRRSSVDGRDTISGSTSEARSPGGWIAASLSGMPNTSRAIWRFSGRTRRR